MLFEVYQPNEIPEDINTQKLYDKYWDKKVAMIRTGALSHLDEGKKRKAKEVKEDLTKNIASEMLTSKQITLREIDIKKIKDEMQGDYYSKIQSIEVKDSKGPIIATQIIKELILEYNTIIDDAYHDLLDEGVLRAQEDSVEFFHQSFFEYVAARALIEKEDKKQLKYLLNNATLLENRAIIQEVILYAKRKKKDEIAYKLLKRLSETNLYTKIFAIDLLKHIENITEEDIKICQHLTEDEIKIRTYLADSLGLITPIHPDLASMLFKKLSKDKDEYVRKGVTGALPKLYDVNPDLASTLIEKLHSDHPYVRKGVAEALPKLYGVNPGLALALIKKLSKDKNEYVRKSVAEALPKLYGVNPGLALTLIKEFLSQDRSIFAIIGLSEALNKLCDVNPDLASTLIEKLSNDEDPWVQMVIEKTLFKLCDVNPDLASMLIEKLGKDRDEEEEWNEFKARPGIYGRYRLLILFYLDPDLASRLTKKICKYEDPVVRSSAAEALSKLCDVNPDLASTLIEKLSNDEDFIARSGAAKALSKLCDVNPDLASTLIEKLSNDKYLLVRKTVAEALPKFCDVYPDFASTLVEKLSNDKCSLLRSDAANALSKLFEVNPDLASSLIDKLSNDKDGEVRRYAAKALLKFDELYPNKARALIKKLKDLEDMDIQKAIKEIIEKREKRHLDRYDLIKKGKDRMRRQEIKIEESTEVESTQKIIGGEGEQIAKIKKGEKIRSKQFIGDEKKKTADSQEFLENLHIENLKKSAKNVQMYCQRQLDAFFASDDIYFRFFTNHASLHSQTILKILKELLLDVELKNDYEYYLLYTAAYAHDIGMLPQKTNGEFEDYTKQEVVEKVRKEHSERSAEHIKKNWREMEMLEKTHSVHLADICKAHSSKVDINKVPERAECVIDGEKVEIRWRFLAALIRLADALDADYNRIPPEFILKP
jgi:HEAT repeat protein